jgi:hypothetical protein
MARVAFMTFGVLHEAWDHARSKGFVDRVPAAYDAADRSDGFIARSARDLATLRHSWGESICPSFLAPPLHAQVAHTFSLWTDLESVYAYAYGPVHAEGLRLRRDWFREPDFPNYVAWWVADDHQPDTVEATQRLEQLRAVGPTPQAFNFKAPFDAAGQPTSLDRDLIKAKIERNGLASSKA